MILPPALTKVLMKLQYSTLNYIPAIYPVPEAVLRVSVSGKLFDLIGDYSFLRNAGASITLFFILLILYLILKVLSIP
jgi:hypothetical protein